MVFTLPGKQYNCTYVMEEYLKKLDATNERNKQKEDKWRKMYDYDNAMYAHARKIREMQLDVGVHKPCACAGNAPDATYGCASPGLIKHSSDGDCFMQAFGGKCTDYCKYTDEGRKAKMERFRSDYLQRWQSRPQKIYPKAPGLDTRFYPPSPEMVPKVDLQCCANVIEVAGSRADMDDIVQNCTQHMVTNPVYPSKPGPNTDDPSEPGPNTDDPSKPGPNTDKKLPPVIASKSTPFYVLGLLTCGVILILVIIIIMM